jgi:HK97 family phage portal protein
MGLSPLRSALRLIFNDEEAEAYCAALLHNMGSPGAIISPAGDKTLQPDEAQRLMNYFNTRFTGDGRGTTMVATGGLTVDMPSYNPKDLDLTNIHQFSESRIAGLMGVAAIVAGLSVGLQHATYSNYGQAREATYDGNIMPTYASFANTLTRALLRDDFGGNARQRVDFDTTNVRALQEDANAVATRAGDLFGKGIIDRARALTLIGDEPQPGDHGVFFVPRGGSFSDGTIAEPVSAVTEKVDTVPDASNLTPPPAPPTNGHRITPVPAANA